MTAEHTWRSWSFWRMLLVQAFAVSLVLLALLVLLGTLNRIYGNNLPVTIVTADLVNLGTVCPGEEYPIHNLVTIDRPAILVYSLSTMNAGGQFNYPETVMIRAGFNHPIGAEFKQTFDWYVPQLPPGTYRRVVGVSEYNSNNKPLFVINYFTIGDC